MNGSYLFEIILLFIYPSRSQKTTMKSACTLNEFDVSACRSLLNTINHCVDSHTRTHTHTFNKYLTIVFSHLDSLNLKLENEWFDSKKFTFSDALFVYRVLNWNWRCCTGMGMKQIRRLSFVINSQCIYWSLNTFQSRSKCEHMKGSELQWQWQTTANICEFCVAKWC